MSDDLTGGLGVAREMIPARVRRGLYAAGSLAGYALTAAVVGFTAAGADVPGGVTVALSVLGALAGPLGQLAAVNVNTAEPLELVEPATESPA